MDNHRNNNNNKPFRCHDTVCCDADVHLTKSKNHKKKKKKKNKKNKKNLTKRNNN